MNILILSWRSPGHPNAGGAEQVTFEHAKGWVAAGHRIVWFSSEFKGGKIQEDISGVTIIRKGDYIVGVRIKALLWYLFGKHPKFDLVVDEFHGIPFFTPLYVRTRRFGFIYEVTKEVWAFNPWPKPFNLLPAILGTFFEPFIFRLFYRRIPFMTDSESTKQDLVSLGITRQNVMVVNPGATLFLPKGHGDKDQKLTAMYLGAISRDKGTEDAIRAFAEIDRKDNQWQFWVVGSGSKDLVQKLKKLTSELDIDKKTTFWGFVSDKRKFELLSRAHVMINPSIHEGWGLVNIEANSVGTPVIGYNVHGLRDSIRDRVTGILVDKGDYRSLAVQAINLMREKERYAKFQKECKKWAARFTWDKATEQSLELIESI